MDGPTHCYVIQLQIVVSNLGFLPEMLEALESGFLGLTPVNHGWILRERIGMEVDLQQQCFIDEIGTSLFGEVDSPSKNDED